MNKPYNILIMKMRSMPSLRHLKGKRILLRLDLNVPVSGSKITDDFKIISAIPTIRQLRSCPLIIISHRGEPKTKAGKYTYQTSYSLQLIVKKLQKYIGGNIFISKGSWSLLKKQAQELKPGDIMVVENLRFWPGEVQNDKNFAKELAALADIYINDAFAVSHRAHASVAAITKYIPSYAGPLLRQEIVNLTKVTKQRSLVVILGGAKISSKLPLIQKLLPRSSAIIMGGGLANTILKVRGYSIGASLYDVKSLVAAKRLTSEKIILPIDVVVQSGKKIFTKSITQVGTKEKIFDIGPETVSHFSSIISKAKTIIWNGPLGLFENKKFQNGTKQIIISIQKTQKKNIFTLAGGGETVEAIRYLKAQSSFTWVSTGGGASLAFLSGEMMPGLQGLGDT